MLSEATASVKEDHKVEVEKRQQEERKCDLGRREKNPEKWRQNGEELNGK